MGRRRRDRRKIHLLSGNKALALASLTLCAALEIYWVNQSCRVYSYDELYSNASDGLATDLDEIIWEQEQQETIGTLSSARKVMFAIGRLSYQAEVVPPALLLGNTSVYGMRTFPTAHNDSHNVQQQAEMGVFFVHSALSASDVEQYYAKVRDAKRVMKHFDVSTMPVTRLNFMTSVNSDVARNFVLLPGLCDQLDGLHVLESDVGLEHVETFESGSGGWPLPSLFHKMRQRGADYLVVMAQEQVSETEGATKLPICGAAEALAVNKSLDAMVFNPLAHKRSEEVVAMPVRREDRAFIRAASTTTSLEEIMTTGKVLVVHGHSSLVPAWKTGPSNDNLEPGYKLQNHELLLSYTDPLSTATRDDVNAAMERMQAELCVVKQVGSFHLRINSEWTPNYDIGEIEDGENRDGLYVLEPGKQMKQVEVWNKATDGASVKELFQTKLSLYECDYLVVLGCKAGMQDHTHVATGEHTVKRVLQDMAQHPLHANLQAWGCAKLGSLRRRHFQFIINQGGIEAILSALQRHPLSAIVVKEAFWALMNFATNADVQSRIVDAGGIEAILKPLRTTPNTISSAPVKYGCGVLHNLAANNRANAHLIATAAGDEVFTTCENFDWRPYHFTMTWGVLRVVALGIGGFVAFIVAILFVGLGLSVYNSVRQGCVKRKRKKRRSVTNTNTNDNKFSPRQTRSQTRQGRARTRSQTRELHACNHISARANQVRQRHTGSLKRRNRPRKRARTHGDRRPSKRSRPNETA